MNEKILIVDDNKRNIQVLAGFLANNEYQVEYALDGPKALEWLKEENFDLDIRIENLKLSIWARYLTSFADDFRGLASGNLRLEGPLSDPALSGRVRSSRTAFRVGYLNVPFSFAHELEIGKNYFFFENLVLNDTLGNRALVSGRITHARFRDFSLDVSL